MSAKSIKVARYEDVSCCCCEWIRRLKRPGSFSELMRLEIAARFWPNQAACWIGSKRPCWTGRKLPTTFLSTLKRHNVSSDDILLLPRAKSELPDKERQKQYRKTNLVNDSALSARIVRSEMSGEYYNDRNQECRQIGRYS
jgi:hypothetical protein